jgi:acyl-CoA synthetase (NDP forming)
VAYPAVLDAFAGSGAYDVLAIVHDFPYRSLPSEVPVAEGVAGDLAAATAGRPAVLPVYISLTSGEPTPEILTLLEAAGGIPVLRGTTEALAAIAGRATWEARYAARAIEGPRRPGWPALARDRTVFGHDPAFQPAEPLDPGDVAGRSNAGPRALPEFESLRLLGAAGLPVVDARPASDGPAAVRAAEALGYPVALKLDATRLAHKSDLGGVIVGLADGPAVAAAAGTLLAIGRTSDIGFRGLLVEPSLPAGVELIVGLRRDPQFGPLVIAGLGGVLAEILDDVAVELAPLSRSTAGAMLDRLRGGRILDGVRGRPAVDRSAVIDLIVSLADLGCRRPDLLEVDLNPVIASSSGARAADALVVIAPEDGAA